jgi:hypothetical protein
MDDAARMAIEQVKRLLEDAEMFRLASIPLPVKVVRALLHLAEGHSASEDEAWDAVS